MKAKDIFKNEWYSICLEHNFSNEEFENKPRLTGKFDNLDWLVPMHPAILSSMELYFPKPNKQELISKNFNLIQEHAIELGIQLPENFIRLLGSTELQRRIPSATACFFELPNCFSLSPFQEDTYLLRFLNDQQYCYSWYLNIHQKSKVNIICSTGLYYINVLEKIDFSDELNVKEAKTNTIFTADSFNEFIYRFWLENTIWFKLEFDIKLTDIEINYMKYFDPDFSENK